MMILVLPYVIQNSMNIQLIPYKQGYFQRYFQRFVNQSVEDIFENLPLGPS